MKKEEVKTKVILKLSGEALSDTSSHLIFSKEKLKKIVDLVNELIKNNINVGIVCGAGNIFRGRIAEENGIPYDDGDYMGMVGTVINLKAISALLTVNNIKNKLYSALMVEDVAPKYNKDIAIKEIDEGYVILFAGGVGKVKHTTDSCAALRAIEMDAKLILAAKNGVDGVYTKDPNKYADAKFIKSLTYKEAIENDLKVMDKQALELLKDSDVITRVFSMDDFSNFMKVINGDENIGTTIKKE